MLLRWTSTVALGALLYFTILAQATKYRTITITTEPNAIVWIDGVRYGNTDENGNLSITTIAAGGHSIRVRADGFKETTKPLTAAQKGEISIPLTRTTDEAELSYQAAESLTGTDRQKAIEAYRKAIRLRPRYPEALLGLARVYSDSRDADNALKAIRDARKLRPAYAELSAIEGRIYKDGGDDAKAIMSFNRSIKEGKGFQPEAHTGLGLLYKEKAEMAGGTDFDFESENYAAAADHLRTAVNQLSGAPDAIVVYQLLGLVFEKQKKFKEALAVYREFLTVFPESSESEAVRSYIVQIEKQMNEPN